MFLDTIPVFANGVSFDAYRDQQLIVANRQAAASFDVAIKQKIKVRLQELNFNFSDDASFVAFSQTRLTTIQINGTDTKIICLDATVEVIEGVSTITDYGTKIAEYYGSGYAVIVPDPSYSVDSIQ